MQDYIAAASPFTMGTRLAFQPSHEEIKMTDTALLVIDVQESFPNRPYWTLNGVPTYLEKQQALIDGCAARGVTGQQYAGGKCGCMQPVARINHKSPGS